MDSVISVGAGSGLPTTGRDGKGRSLLSALDSYVIVDIETTGLSPRYDEIIEVAALRVEGGKVAEQFTQLINPGRQVSGFITELTGITNGMVAAAPDRQSVLPQFMEFVGGSVLVAHNANFDVNFLYDNYATLPEPQAFSNDFIDTMRLSRRLFPEERRHRLEDLIHRFKVADAVKHRALADCSTTYECYEHMKKYGLENAIDFGALYPKKYRSQNWTTVKAADIRATVTDIDEDTEIFGETFVFTGTLERMARKEAMQTVVNRGGICGDRITQQTNYLVLGNNDYCSSIKGGKSAKHKKAENYKLKGLDIEIITEDVFYDMLGE